MKFSLFIFMFISSVAVADLLDEVIENTRTDDYQIELREQKLNDITGNSLNDVVTRTQLLNEVKFLKQEKGRKLLMEAIENTDTSTMPAQTTTLDKMRFSPRKKDLGSETLNSVVDKTVEESNPAVKGKNVPNERPLVLYRDANPEDLYMAKEIGSGIKDEKIVVYKSTDLRGRVAYKTVDRRVVNVVVFEKVFPKEEVIYKDVDGNLKKGLPRAIYKDGTLEIAEKAGTTTRRAPGTYHLSDEVNKIDNGSLQTHSGKMASPYEDFSKRDDLTASEKRALENLKKALCNL